MKLEDQVCSLELSKKLLTFGVKQNSIFVWEYYDDQCHGVKFIPYAIVPNQFNNCQLYSAFTIAELGELLPHIIDTKQNEPFNNFRINMQIFISMEDGSPKKCYILNYHCDTVQVDSGSPFFNHTLTKNIHDENEANARAKMLVYLMENNLWKP